MNFRRPVLWYAAISGWGLLLAIAEGITAVHTARGRYVPRGVVTALCIMIVQFGILIYSNRRKLFAKTDDDPALVNAIASAFSTFGISAFALMMLLATVIPG
jgi:uncharacterized membrane protein